MNWRLLDIRTGKIGRLRFFIYRAGLIALVTILNRIGSDYISFNTTAHVIGISLFLSAIFYLTLLIQARRLRDIGIHPAFCLFEIFIYAMVAALFAFVEFGLNRYSAHNWENIFLGALNILFLMYIAFFALLIFKKGETHGFVDILSKDTSAKLRANEKKKLATQLDNLY